MWQGSNFSGMGSIFQVTNSNRNPTQFRSSEIQQQPKSEYDQEIPQSHTADQPTHREEEPEDIYSFRFLFKMIAKLEWTQVMHNKAKTNTEPPQTMGSSLTIDQQQQNHRLKTVSSLSHPGSLKRILLALNVRPRFCCC